jgi:hypothetical protein
MWRDEAEPQYVVCGGATSLQVLRWIAELNLYKGRAHELTRAFAGHSVAAFQEQQGGACQSGNH